MVERGHVGRIRPHARGKRLHLPRVTNNERAAIGEKAILAVFRDDIESGGIDLGTGIYDLVADLLHLARENGIEPDYIIHMAQMHFDAEVEEEAGL